MREQMGKSFGTVFHSTNIVTVEADELSQGNGSEMIVVLRNRLLDEDRVR